MKTEDKDPKVPYVGESPFDEQPEEGSTYLQPSHKQEYKMKWGNNYTAYIGKLDAEISRLKEENERLMKLIETVHSRSWNAGYAAEEKNIDPDKWWQQFKTENNLNH